MTVVQGPDGGSSSTKNTASNAPLFLPSIYRYTCQGAFHVSTDTPGSVGTCRGIRSNLEHVLDFEAASRTGAIHQFTTTLKDVELTPEVTNQQQEAVELLKEKENPALIYPPKKTKNHQLPIIASDLETKLKIQNTVKDLDDEDSTSLILRDSWSAYGSTEVECLQLTSVQDGKTEIVAVAPYNHALVSSRTIATVQGSSVTSVQVGFGQKLEFVLERNKQQDPTSTTYETEYSTVTDLNNSIAEIPGAPPAHWWDAAQQVTKQAKQWGTKSYEFSTKVTDKMESNRVWLNEQVKQDFYQRTMASGKRTVEYMPTMAVALGKSMKQLLGLDNDTDNDDRPGSK